jgi:hypothetical protein
MLWQYAKTGLNTIQPRSPSFDAVPFVALLLLIRAGRYGR